MRKVVVAFAAVLLSSGVMATTHAGAFVCAPGSAMSTVELNAAGALGPQGEMLFGLFNSIDGLVMSRANATDTIC